MASFRKLAKKVSEILALMKFALLLCVTKYLLIQITMKQESSMEGQADISLCFSSFHIFSKKQKPVTSL